MNLTTPKPPSKTKGMNGCLKLFLVTACVLIVIVPSCVYFGGKAVLKYAETSVDKPSLLAIIPTTPSAENTFAPQCPPVTFPYGIRIPLPSDWRVLSRAADATIRTNAVLGLERNNLPLPSGVHSNLFRANSPPSAAFASIAVNVNELVLTHSDLNEAGKLDLLALGASLKTSVTASAAAAGQTVISFEDIMIVTVGQALAILVNYERTGPEGPVAVRMIRIPRKEVEVAITLAYRKTAGQTSEALIDYMTRGIVVE